MPLAKRKQNEKKFSRWEELSSGGRRYFYEVLSSAKWKARYVKEVNEREETIQFYQEIYNEKDELIEVHQKYPVDKGHKKVGGGSSNDNSG